MDTNTLKNRIVGHRKVAASTLQPHPLNPRTHTDTQRQALNALLEEIGLARSVLAYIADKDRDDPTQPLTLIDGHLRREELRDELVEVEILDVNDAEARDLLLPIDPLAQLAGYDAENLAELRKITEPDFDAVTTLWNAITAANEKTDKELKKAQKKKAQEQVEESYQIIIDCTDEKHQVALLRKLKKDGLPCKALIS